MAERKDVNGETMSKETKDKAIFSTRRHKSAPVGVISKMLRILEILHAAPAGLPLRCIAERTHIHKSTVYRFLSHLEDEGYLFRDESDAYMPGPMLLRLGCAASYQMTLRKISRPVLQDLRNTTGETVNLGILNGRDVCYVDVVQSRNTFDRASRIGTVRPLYCTAMGKMLVAVLPVTEKERILDSLRFERLTPHTITELSKLKSELASIQQKGYALDNEEASLGARCIGVPIFLEGNQSAAALSLAGPTNRIPSDRIPFLVNAVQNAARTITARFSHGA